MRIISGQVCRRGLLSVLLLITGLLYIFSSIFPSFFNLSSSDRFVSLDSVQIAVTGIVSEIKNNTGTGSVLTLSHVKTEGTKISFKKNEKVMIYSDAVLSTDVSGTCVRAVGTFRLFDPATNPGQFDLRKYYDNRSVPGKLVDAGIFSETDRRGCLFCQWKAVLARFRSQMTENAISVLGDEDGGILSAMVLGDRSGVPDEIYSLYQNSGISHLIAVSGLHVGLVGMTIYRFLRRRRWSYRKAGYCSGFVLWIYCLLTGMGVSALRAFVMYAVWILSQIIGRKSDPPTTMGVAAFVIAVLHPGYLRESSFFLSFVCVISIYIADHCFEKGRFSLPDALHISLFVMLGTLPVTAYFFYQISPYSVFSNLIIIPLMSLLFIIGSLSITVSLFFIPGGVFLSGICRYILLLYKMICVLQMKIPGAVWVTGRPGIIWILLYYLAFFFFVRRKSRKPGFLFLVILIISLYFAPLTRNSVRFLDVGQGDCILIHYNGLNAMIDCGSSSVENVWSKRTQQVLKYYGIRKLDYIFLTHEDSDHINGVEEFLSDYANNRAGKNQEGISLGALVFSSNERNREQAFSLIREKAEKNGIPILYMENKDRIHTNSLDIEMLFPTADAELEEENQRSLVLNIRMYGISFLLTGDMEKEEEELFCRDYADYYVTNPECILKAGHHGSRYATSYEMLEAVRPYAAVISCGKNNRYGHPSEAVLFRLSEAGVRCIRTDRQGAVFFYPDRHGVSCEYYNMG